MSRRKSRSTSSTEKTEIPRSARKMTVHRRNEEGRGSYFPGVSPAVKSHWPAAGNDSSSWERNSRATSSSWPSDMEESTTRKIIQLWCAIERNIYGEDADDKATYDGLPIEECTQWRSQLLHLRIVGNGASSSKELEETSRKRGQKSAASKGSDQMISEDKLCQSQASNDDPRYRLLLEDEKEVYDIVLEHVCNALTRGEEVTQYDADTKGSLSEDLDKVLRITPAPTYSGKKWANGRSGKRDPADSRKTSANVNHKDSEKSCVDQACDDSHAIASPDNDGPELDDDEACQAPRNKLGTVFNEKIVVSPVPFVVSTRESFTTLRTTPISFRDQNFTISSSRGLERYMNSASRMNFEQRIFSSRIPQIHSAWQAPVCPTVWPKNVKLAPIDPSRISSSKNRSAIDSMAALPHRNRNSLSPISRPTKSVNSAKQRNISNNNNIDPLEIHGKKILTRSAKKNLPKTGWDCSPRSPKSSSRTNKTRAMK